LLADISVLGDIKQGKSNNVGHLLKFEFLFCLFSLFLFGPEYLAVAELWEKYVQAMTMTLM
jgi:hypothetical protein